MKAALVLIFALTSCEALQPTLQNKLTGEWRYADGVQSCHYVFKRDGSFYGEVTYRRKFISKFTGHWSVQDNALLYRYTSDALDRIPIGSIDRDKLLAVRRDSFTIQAADGSKRRYSRIR